MGLLLLLSHLLSMPGMVSAAERPLYLSGMLKLQLTAEAIRQTRLPEGLYSEADAFGIKELDDIFRGWGGNKILRAHRKVNNLVWEQETGFDRWFLVQISQEADIPEVIAVFKKSALIQDASPEYLAYPALVPNDEFYPLHWGHNNTAQLPGNCDPNGNHSGEGVGLIGFDVRSELAWEDVQGFGIAEIVIAIIDSGADLGHPDLRLVTGYDYGDNDSDPMDNCTNVALGHGTACSGVAAGRGNNGFGVIGIAGGCSVMPLKMLDSSGNFSFTSMENCLTHAADHGARVVSMSFGSNISPGASPASDAALAYAYESGLVLCAATGNDNNSSIIYPANHPNVISVGAASPCGHRKSPSTCDGDTRWGSNYGSQTQDSNFAVDIMAPVILPTTDLQGATGYTNGDYYMWFAGTSCAAPFLAGAAALVLSKNPDLSPDEVRTAITSTATDMTLDGGAGWDRYTGYGMVDAYAALASVSAGNPFVAITSPMPNTSWDSGEVIQVTADAVATLGEIAQVLFFAGDLQEPAYVDTAYPWIWNLDTADYPHGNLIIKVQAISSSGHSSSRHVQILNRHPADEGFESGNFLALPWTQSGNGNWMVVSAVKYSGSYSARSASIGTNQFTSLSLILDVSETSAVSFFLKVSSHHQTGFLKFYINDVLQGQWSGDKNWSLISYPVGTGQKTLRWTYNRSSSLVGGSDCAWLDHIMLPVYNRVYAAPRNLMAVGWVNQVSLSWLVPVYGFPSAYRIYRNGAYYDFTSATGYVDDQVNNGNTYTYRVSALYGLEESMQTSSASAVPVFAGAYIAVDNDFLGASLLEGESAADGFAISNLGSQVLTFSIGFQPEPLPSWLGVNPLFGSLPSRGHQQIVVSFNSIGIEPGIYETVLLINSNDPANQQLSIPVMLELHPAGLDIPVVTIDRTGDDFVILSWPEVSGATAYRIYVSNSPDGAYQQAGQTDDLYWQQPVLQNRMRQFFRVIAIGD